MMNTPLLRILFLIFWVQEGLKVAVYAITMDFPHFAKSALFMMMFAYLIQRFMIPKSNNE